MWILDWWWLIRKSLRSVFLRNHEFFPTSLYLKEKPRFVGVPGKLPSILQYMGKWLKQEEANLENQSILSWSAFAAFGNATCGNLRVWGSWCWTGRFPSLSRTCHRGTLLVTVVRFCPLVESLLSWYKSHVHVQSHAIVSCYIIYIYIIMHWLLITVSWSI